MKRTIKLIKRIVLITIIGVAIGAAIFFGVPFYQEHTKEAPVTPVATTTPDIIEEYQDVLDESQEELLRIKQELDNEEQKLLDEIDERELRLERIRELRLSFQ